MFPALLDIGNTHTRILRLDAAGRTVESRAVRTAELGPEALPPDTPVAACSVVPAAAARLAGCDIRFLTPGNVPATLLDLSKGDYTTLGADRLANVLAALERANGGAVAVLDFGTAITLELAGADRVFRGGAILPGRKLQRRALYQGTAQLPEPPIPGVVRREPGRSTIEAIEFGVDRGLIGAVRELVGAARRELGEGVRIFACGGDAGVFLADLPELEYGGEEFTLRGVLRWYRGFCAARGQTANGGA